MELALEKRKFFCIVCTHADHLVKVADNLQKQQLAELEEQLRRDLSLLQNLNVRVFILSIPFLKDHKMEQYIIENCQKLHFPVLEVYLSQPRGLLDEIQIHAFVKEEVYKALERFLNVKKRHQALDFSQHLAAGVLLPIAGPIMVSFLKTLKHTLRACVDVGLIEDSDKAMKEVDEDANKHKLSVKIATKEGLVTAVHDSLIHIFGRVVFDIAIAEVVSTAAESAVSGAVPVAGAVVSAAHLPRRYVKIGQKLAIKACMLHELWIMQNITRLLGKT
ncbi:hypothetical protein KP509_39G015300 [Ceratopteris richardii]|nr:hypothetical protein KP509_39G015300 [Ceratopteris richardii]